MIYLPLANLWHHKLRNLLSALGIGIGICMLITLGGLSRGSLFEVARRWESVDADLIVFPRGWGENATNKSGAALSDRLAKVILTRRGDMVQRVVPVFLWPIKMGGQNQMAAGVDPAQWATLTGGRKLSEGRLFDPDNRFSDWIEKELLTSAKADADDEADTDEPVEDRDFTTTGPPGGLEMVIDTRLARAGGYRAGQTVFAANHHWRIVGIVPAGAMSRVFIPRRTAQYLFGSGQINRSTLMFVKLRAGADIGPAGRAISRLTLQDVVPLASYRDMLTERFGIMFIYVDIVNAIALIIAFLFVLVTLYTTVLQQTREIAILKANGATNAFILRQVLGESLLLTTAGAMIGIGMSFLAGGLIERYQPLLTVTITWHWIAIALASALLGSFVSALYPAWRATRVDIVTALSLE